MAEDNLLDMISFDEVSNVPARQRSGGGGGKRSEFLDSLRENLATPGRVAKIQCRRQNARMRDPNTKKLVPVLDRNGNPVLEEWSDAFKRITSRVHRPGALPFHIQTRTIRPESDDDAGVVEIYHMQEQEAVEVPAPSVS